MKFYQSIIDDLVEKICNDDFKFPHHVIIGENASGKSEILRRIISLQLKKKIDIYYIDAVNRGFNVSKTIKEKKMPQFKDSVVMLRLDEQYYNLQDSFSCYGTQTERIEEIYSYFEEDVQKLLQEFLGETFEVLYDQTEEVGFGESKGKLSSGYQAVTRILLELLYIQRSLITANSLECLIVVIDEIDEFLSPNNAGRLLPFIVEKFPIMHFIVSTHSIDLVVGACKANLIILANDVYEVSDVEEFTTLSEAALVFNKIFGKEKAVVNEAEDLLRRLLNNKIAGAWGKIDEEELSGMDFAYLSNSQKMLYKQIVEWDE